MNLSYRFIIILVVLFMALPVIAQVQHSGTVTDAETGDPLIGVNVLVKGLTIGAATNVDGEYSFAYTSSGDYTLAISFVGYRTVEQSSQDGNVTDLNIQMEVDPFGMDEIVVTGLVSRTSRAVSEVSVSRINIASLTEKADYASMDEMIAGKLSGVEVHKTFGTFGAPMRFNMRSGGGINGNAQPVIYVDGIKIANDSFGRDGGNTGISTLNSLNPEEIENIEVIKGSAGASSYGTGGSNGVILITTKRGRLGTGGTKNWAVNYKGTVGQHQQQRQYDENDMRQFQAVNDYFVDGLIQKNNLNVSGGTEQMRLYAGVDRSFEKGEFPQSNQDLTNLRANFDYLPNDKFTVQVSSGYQLGTIQLPGDSRGGHEWKEVLMRRWPYDLAKTNRSKNYYRSRTRMNFMNSFTASVVTELTPFVGTGNRWLEGLSGRFTIGIDDKDQRNVYTLAPTTFDLDGRKEEGERAVNQRNLRNFTYNGDIRSNYNLAGINFTSTVGAQLFEESGQSVNVKSQQFVTSLIPALEAGDIVASATDIESNFRSAGIFAETTLDYNSTYFATAMVRRDYASVLGVQSSDIIYPNFRGAIRLDRFDSAPSFFNLLKLRAAYGETGILPGRIDGIPLLWSAINSAYGAGAALSAVGNPDLKPERIAEFEIGLDTEFMNYAWEVSWYETRATDSIVNKSLLPSTGKTASPRKFNVGKIEGRGFESLFQGFFSGPRLGGWSVNFTLTNSWQENEVTDLGGGEEIREGPGGGTQSIQEGLPKNSFFNVRTEGANFSDGTDVVVDKSSPLFGQVAPVGVITGGRTSEEDKFLGKGVPDWIGSFSGTLSAFDFSLYGLFEWKTGFVLYNETYIDQMWQSIKASRNPGWENGIGTQVLRFDQFMQQLGYCDCNVSKTDFPTLEPGTPEYIEVANAYAQTSWYEDANGIQPGDFIRLKELSLTYNASKLIPRFGWENYIQSLSFGFGGTNLWLATKDEFIGIDPESQSFAVRGHRGNSVQTYMQNAAFPQGRTWYTYVRLGI